MIGVVAFSQPYYLRGIRLIHMDDVTISGIGDLEGKLVDGGEIAAPVRAPEYFGDILESDDWVRVCHARS